MDLEFLTLDDVDITNKRILIREDFNVPIKDGMVQSDLRIRAALPGIKQALAANAQVILMSHLGRPEAGHWQAEFSLQPVAICLQNLLNTPVTFIKDWQHSNIPQDKLILLENVRFLIGETENAPVLAKDLAELCDIFVLDAFGSAHRAHASTVGVAEFAPVAVAGPLLVDEVAALQQIMHNPRRPLLAIIGGAKISSKLAVLQSLATMVDVLIVGGGMANTLLADPQLLPAATCKILLPVDGVKNANNQVVDIGAATIQNYVAQIAVAATILWNGPLGVFEDPRFAHGTAAIAKAIANSKAYSVIGGGDTLTAVDQLHLTGQFSYISTGGGAFLEYIEGKSLPAIIALTRKGQYVKTN